MCSSSLFRSIEAQGLTQRSTVLELRATVEPEAAAALRLPADFSRTALYDELASRCGVAPTRGSERIEPAHPTPEDAGRLGVSEITPVFNVTRSGRTSEHVIEHRRTVIRGDRYAFVADWGDGRSTGLRADAHP